MSVTLTNDLEAGLISIGARNSNEITPQGGGITGQQTGGDTTKMNELASAVEGALKSLKNIKVSDKEAKDRLRRARKKIDAVLEPTFFEWLAVHKTLIITVFLTVVGILGSVLGLVQGSVSEKQRTAFVLTGAILSLVGNTVSSATGIYVPPPGMKKAPEKDLHAPKTVMEKKPEGEIEINKTLDESEPKDVVI